MHIKVDDLTNNTKVDIVVCYDNCGNIYFKTMNDNYYYLTIGNDDDLCIEYSENMKQLLDNVDINEINVTLEKIKNSNDVRSLKGKILNELEKNNDDDEEYDTNSEDEREETEFDINNKFFPEQKYYYHEEQDDDEYLEEDEFKFFSSGDTSVLQFLNLNLNAPANYNTLVMNQSSKIVEMSLEIVGSNSYILILYTTGDIELNVVGSKRKSFKLAFKLDNFGVNNLSSYCTNICQI